MAPHILLAEVKIFVALREEGFSYQRIAEKMGRSRAMVIKHVQGYKKHGEDWFSVQHTKNGG